MAELEAITDVRTAKDKSGIMSGQYGRRLPLVSGKLVRIGRDETKVDWAVPEDDQISRFYAFLQWDGSKLTVERRGSIPPDYPEPPPNRIIVLNPDLAAKEKHLEVTKCAVGPGESFWIGQTQFTVREDGDSGQDSPVDATVAPRQEERTRAQLEEIPFTNPAVALKAMEQLPSMIKAAANEQGLFRQMLRVVMDALPRADAAGIVRIPPDCPPGDLRLALVESNVRSPIHFGPMGFAPSRKLAHRAIQEARKRSHLHFWSTDPRGTEGGAAADMTLAVMHQQNVTPWAICTPFQDGSRYALYIAGRVNGLWAALDKPGQDRVVADLTQYQKIAEIIVGLIETTMRMARLSRQNAVIRRAWPQGIWKYLDDPDRLETMLRPQEKEITILFCDLRNYSLFASQNAAQLLQAQKEVAVALNTMSSAITDRDGVVAGFRGDAVLGFWGWPDPHERQVEMAVRAALAIQGRLSDWSQTGRCGLGLTHGRAVAGRLGAHDLAVVDLYGPVVNLAFRLEAMTKAFGVGIIVSQEVADRVARADPNGVELRTRKLGRVRAKGFPDPVPANELYSAHLPSVREWQQQDWAAAVDLFTEGRWADAADMLSQLFPEDPAAGCLLRVMDETRRVPPKNWDGSFVPPSPSGG
ncbi:MAG: adenylate/guanylate cyclase protein [Gemmataceae bacterium]|nr:adenylate/guanylate cyclase protein [Gemmataceae bacterium]